MKNMVRGNKVNWTAPVARVIEEGGGNFCYYLGIYFSLRRGALETPDIGGPEQIQSRLSPIVSSYCR